MPDEWSVDAAIPDPMLYPGHLGEVWLSMYDHAENPGEITHPIPGPGVLVFIKFTVIGHQGAVGALSVSDVEVNGVPGCAAGAPGTFTVDQATTTTMLISDVNPALVGTTVTFTATVTSPLPSVVGNSGKVTFTDETLMTTSVRMYQWLVVWQHVRPLRWQPVRIRSLPTTRTRRSMTLLRATLRRLCSRSSRH